MENQANHYKERDSIRFSRCVSHGRKACRYLYCLIAMALSKHTLWYIVILRDCIKCHVIIVMQSYKEMLKAISCGYENMVYTLL